MIENTGKYYLYRHTRLDKNEPFYVGIGTVEELHKESHFYRSYYKRAFNKNNRSNLWKNIINKTDYEVEILLESDDYEFIKQKEIEFIALYGRRDLKEGCLVNLTDGGEGSNLYRGKDFMYNKPRTVELREQYEGKIFPTKTGGDVKVLKFINTQNILVEFLEGGDTRRAILNEIKKGTLKNKKKINVGRIGFVGGEVTNPRVYKIWASFLNRNSKRYGVCKEWTDYQNFEKWYEKNYYPKEGYEIEIYSNLLEDSPKEAGKNNSYFLPQKLAIQLKPTKGYYIRKDGRIHTRFLRKHINYFKTIDEAIKNFKIVKKEYIITLANKYKNIMSEDTYNKILNYEIKIKNE